MAAAQDYLTLWTLRNTHPLETTKAAALLGGLGIFRFKRHPPHIAQLILVAINPNYNVYMNPPENLVKIQILIQ